MKITKNMKLILELNTTDCEKLSDICELARRRLGNRNNEESFIHLPKDLDIYAKDVAYDKALSNTLNLLFEGLN